MPDTSVLAVRRAEALKVIAAVVEELGKPERAERIASWRNVPGGIPATINTWEIDATTPTLLAGLAEIVAEQQDRIGKLEAKLEEASPSESAGSGASKRVKK